MPAREEIEAMLAARTEAMSRFDADAVMAFYVEKCELIVDNLPALKGRAAIRDFFATMFADGTFEPAFVIQDLQVQGTLAVLFARELLTRESRLEATLDQFALRHMAMLSCVQNRWLIVRSMVSLEGPGALEENP